jgi:hypothetical protein
MRRRLYQGCEEDLISKCMLSNVVHSRTRVHILCGRMQIISGTEKKVERSLEIVQHLLENVFELFLLLSTL